MFAPSRYLPSPHDPFQPLDRRWRRCHYLVRHGRRPSGEYDDQATFDGWCYLLDRRTCRDRSDLQRLAQRHPAVAAAYYLSRQARQSEPLKKAEVEARLLARQTDDDIAALCGLSAAAVGAYHDLFFNVRDSLNSDFYIFNSVIGLKPSSGLTEKDVTILLKGLGYAHGPFMVDAALRYFRNPPALPVRLDGLDAAALNELQLMLLIRKVILTMVTPACAPIGKNLPAVPASTADGSASLGLEQSADRSVANFLRNQVLALMPAGPSAVLPFDRSVMQNTPEQLEASLAALCG